VSLADHEGSIAEMLGTFYTPAPACKLITKLKFKFPVLYPV
jgi:hypothetical protein